MSTAFTPGPENKICLRLVKTHDREVICDQDNRELDSVTGFRYERLGVEDDAVLTIKLMVQPAEWAKDLGIAVLECSRKGEPVALEPTKIM